MRKICFVVGFSIMAGGLVAQKNDGSKYAAVITKEGLKKQLTIIASDEMQGRETGTEGQRRAAAYIESQFKKIGLKPAAALKGYQQLYPLYRDSLISSSLMINDKNLEFGKDYNAPANTNNSTEVQSNKIVFAGYGITDKGYDDYSLLDVKGAVVVFFLGEPKSADGNYLISGGRRATEWSFPGISKKLALAKEKGAVAALVINPNSETFTPRTIESAKKTNVYYPRGSADDGINYAILTHAAARDLLSVPVLDSALSKAKANALLNKQDIKTINANFKFDYKREHQQIDASNVLGIIEGTDKKDEYVFLTGHYDHLGIQKSTGKIFYGADDDGSGTCAVIQMAEAFAKAKKEGHGPRRTIVFMTVSGEEKGLWGSEYYSDNPVFSLEKTSVDLNTDMVGRIDTERKTDDTLNYLYVIGHDKISSDLPVINEGVNDKFTKLKFDYKFDDPNDQNRIYFRSDHYNFARKGVPILFFYDGMLKADYHQVTDTIDKIYWDLYAKRVQMIFYTAWEIANRDEMLKRDKPLPPSAR